MKNTAGEIIYIGKAKDLFKRVGSYFRQRDKQAPKTYKMVENIADIDYSITSSELEALILETNLIKEHRPKYNVLMKDDKNYAYIKITTAEDYPRIMVVRKVLNDQAKYFGPKTDAGRIYDTLNTLRKIFPFRNCQLQIADQGSAPAGDINKKRLVKVTRPGIKYPCLDLHIKRCLAPCVGKPGLEEYQSLIKKIIELLSGKHEPVLQELKEQMRLAAKDKKFEQAAKIRDQILSIENIFQNQLVSAPDHQFSDIINFYAHDDYAFFNVFQIREGKLIDQQNVILKKPPLEETSAALLSSFIQQFYADNSDLPREIVLPESSDQDAILEKWLTEKSGHKIHFKVPRKGKKDKLLELSLENAFSFAKQSRAKWEGVSSPDRAAALDEIAQQLGLAKIPKRIECYDISHLAGTNTVASMAVFENGYPRRDQYRHFRISLDSPGAPDDFASLREVILRRLKYLKPNLSTAVFTITQKKEALIIKKRRQPFLKLMIITANKLKVFIKPFQYPGDGLHDLLRSIINKFDTRRLYLQIPKKRLKDFEEAGFQLVNTATAEYRPAAHLATVVYDKTRQHEDVSFLKKPDLIVIDGGKGQLSYAFKALQDFHLTIPVISLAKKEEEIYLPGNKTPLRLPENDPARLLLQHLRDESHRFAIEYNRKLRQRDYTVSALENIPGIGKKITGRLLREFGSLENIRNLSDEALAAVVGTKTALKIKSHFH